ncbi:MAG TPA: filamentous hemagglutinin N-terminal domain-containing protein [Gammaproteobacteria bacterium]|nr:filamentous hemagglutinin N-terminal domain-containing protein [Gammaproteobacteria bacterium]
MTSEKNSVMGKFALLLGGMALAILPTVSNSEVTLLGSAESLSGQIVISPEQGLLAGSNLLHSFNRFHIRSGESLTFTGPSTISNVLARVAGNEASEINGLLRSSIAQANLFLLNPNGVMFGPEAAISVDGALYVSTADTLQFGDGTQLLISESGNSEITVAAPEVFGFNSLPASITFNGSEIVTASESGGTLSDLDSLHLYAGSIELVDSRLSLPDTPVQLVAVEAASDIRLDDERVDGLLDSGARLGSIVIRNQASKLNADIETSGDAGGKITLLADSVRMDAANIFSDTAGDNDGLGISVSASGSLNLVNASRITTDTTAGSGRGGDILIDVNTLQIDGLNSIIASNNNTSGGGGQISITADEVVLSNEAAISSITRSFGDGGSITLDTRSLQLQGDAEIRGQTATAGNGANIIINATDSVTIGNSSEAGDASGILVSSAAFFGLAGRSGSIAIETPKLDLLSGSLQSRSLFPGSGAGGDITVLAADLVLEADAEISASTFSGNDAGTINIVANQFIHNGTLSASTSRTGNAGTINIDTATFTVTGEILAFTSSQGNGGSMDIISSDLLIDGGLIDVRTEDSGNAGSISINSDLVSVSNLGEVNSSVLSGSAGQGGVIIIDSNALALDSGGALNTDTAGGGTGGTINFSVRGLLSVAGADSQINSNTTSTAAGGNIIGNAADIELTSGGSITTAASADGFAGNINLDALINIDVSGGRIRTDSEQSGGGNISVDAINRLYLLDGELTASARGDSVGDDGGNVTIDPVFVITNNSRIVAQAIAGDGGIIELDSQVFLSDRNSLISATSELGNDGEVRIFAPDNAVTGVLGVLQPAFADVVPLLESPCAATALDERSSLIYVPTPIRIAAPDDVVTGSPSGCSP